MSGSPRAGTHSTRLPSLRGSLDVVGAPDLERALRVVRRGVLDLHVVVVVGRDLVGGALIAGREQRLHRALVENLESDIAPGKAARKTTGLHTVNSSRGCAWRGLPRVRLIVPMNPPSRTAGTVRKCGGWTPGSSPA